MEEPTRTSRRCDLQDTCPERVGDYLGGRNSDHGSGTGKAAASSRIGRTRSWKAGADVAGIADVLEGVVAILDGRRRRAIEEKGQARRRTYRLLSLLRESWRILHKACRSHGGCFKALASWTIEHRLSFWWHVTGMQACCLLNKRFGDIVRMKDMKRKIWR
jgi:hypothetical protein